MKQTKLADLGEFAFLERLSRRVQGGRGVEIGIGDDCAVVRVGRRRLLLTTDALVEDVHFRRSWDSADGLGRRAYAVNASDIAAMGGVPRFALLSLAVPPPAGVAELDALLHGFAAAARRDGCSLVGGNLSAAPRWMISVTVVGEPTGAPLTRAGARPGDAIYVSGRLGAAAYARDLLLTRGRRPPAAATVAFRRPVARVSLGQILSRGRLATAAIDVSDGLLQDLGHVARASGVGAVIEAGRLPIAPALRVLPRARALRLALAGGEDYELLFTVLPRKERRLRAAAIGRRVRRIGTIVHGSGVRVVDERGHELHPTTSGFDHFACRGT